MKKSIKILIIAFGSLVIFALLLFGFYFFTFNTSAWLKYPNPLKTQVAFMRLEMSSYRGGCSEDCLIEQSILRKMIADYLLKEPVVMQSQIRDYILDSEINNDFKLHLLHVLKKIEEEKREGDETYKIQAPEYLVNYLAFPDKGDHEVKRQIMSVFGEEIGLNSGFLDGLIKIIEDTEIEVDERVQAMRDLRDIIAKEEEESSEQENGPFPKYRNIKYEGLCKMFRGIAEKEINSNIKEQISKNIETCEKFKIFDKKEENQ